MFLDCYLLFLAVRYKIAFSDKMKNTLAFTWNKQILERLILFLCSEAQDSNLVVNKIWNNEDSTPWSYRWTLKNATFSLPIVLTCFTRFSEKTTIISLIDINPLSFSCSVFLAVRTEILEITTWILWFRTSNKNKEF